jgi:NAD(P)-dependent dehydrogenase (short-subunit alcohol dehydrogenase family)
MKRLANKVAIVTGGAGGIGAATAKLFCEHGAKVALVDLPDSPLEAVAKSVQDAIPGAEVICIPVNLAIEASAAEVISRVVSHWGQLDILVNNAGMRSYEPLADSTSDVWNQIIAVNLLSYVYMAREALPRLRQSKAGSIVNVSSTHAFHPRVGMGQYDVTKAGIVSLTKTLAFEEAVHGVRVNAVCPGLTLTPFHVKRAQADGKTEHDLRQEDVTHNIQKRWSEPREIAYPILWLACNEASFVTGSVLMVDGGTRV